MSSRSARQRPAAVLGVLATLLVAASALAAIGGAPGAAGPGMRLATSGAISLSSSKQGEAIFGLANVGPGGGGQGEVTIANSGSAPGTLSLASRDLSDDPGTYGGTLSERLELRLLRVGGVGSSEIYAGPLGAMPELQLGTLAAGESRTYRFLVTMFDGGAPSAPWADDNRYQHANAALGYQWTLTETEGGGPQEPEPEPPQSPATPPAPPMLPPATAPPPAAAPVPLPALRATPRADRLVGTAGNDTIRGLAGADRIWGGAGRDRLFGGPGADHLFGGPGPDTIFAHGGGADLVDCGSARDRAFVDARDRVRHCERVIR
jgi:Ca2+-binding RTX toxin-like protein